MAKNPRWVVWSSDSEGDQTFEDVVRATDAEDATRKITKRRPYTIMDPLCGPMLLTDNVVFWLNLLTKEELREVLVKVQIGAMA